MYNPRINAMRRPIFLILVCCLSTRHVSPFHVNVGISSFSPWNAIDGFGRKGALFAGPQPTAEKSWFPNELLDNLDCRGAEEAESRSLELMSTLVLDKLASKKNSQNLTKNSSETNRDVEHIASIVRGKFIDLCCTLEGERLLESLFDHREAREEKRQIVLGAVACLQSLLVLGSHYGLKGTEEQFEKWNSHLFKTGDEKNAPIDYGSKWDALCIRRLKYKSDRMPALKLLAKLKRKRSAQGAFDLLVALGAFGKHENLALLRSGFPIRFNDTEIQLANEILDTAYATRDPDSLLGVRRDMREQKVFTIDSASTSEIDDGLSCEKFVDKDGVDRFRYWIHIADADYWAPRDSAVFDVAKRRATSHYLPDGSISMFPERLSNAMSLTAGQDAFALSLCVELADDGSIIDSSIEVFPSIVQVTYRLTYDDVDEMLQEGLGYREEWQLGAMLSAAQVRREYRVRNGSSEHFVPTPIPQYSVSAIPNKNHPDGIETSVTVKVSHNSGKNQSSLVEYSSPSGQHFVDDTLSSASLLVTEMMILGGEAIARWKMRVGKGEIVKADSTSVRLPFRSQPKPDYRSRTREKSMMDDLLANNIGGGYCHAWYARRFLSPVQVCETPKPHSGLGLQCYCQWTSPIRRFGDLQAHTAVKRAIRRCAVTSLRTQGDEIPEELTLVDIGVAPSEKNKTLSEYTFEDNETDVDIDFSESAGLLRPAKILQRRSNSYWILEHIRRRKMSDPEISFEVLVLGCINPARRQYAVYIYDLGFEWRYTSPVDSLQSGMRFRTKVGVVLPHNGQLTLVRLDL